MPTFTKTVEIDVEVDLGADEILESLTEDELRKELMQRDSSYRSIPDQELLETLTEAADVARKYDKLSLAIRLEDIIKDWHI